MRPHVLFTTLLRQVVPAHGCQPIERTETDPRLALLRKALGCSYLDRVFKTLYLRRKRWKDSLHSQPLRVQAPEGLSCEPG